MLGLPEAADLLRQLDDARARIARLEAAIGNLGQASTPDVYNLGSGVVTDALILDAIGGVGARLASTGRAELFGALGTADLADADFTSNAMTLTAELARAVQWYTVTKTSAGTINLPANLAPTWNATTRRGSGLPLLFWFACSITVTFAAQSSTFSREGVAGTATSFTATGPNKAVFIMTNGSSHRVRGA